jgi:hypothetical protein
MDGKLSSVADAVKCFCAEQTFNFYFGMALAVLLILNLWTFVPRILGACLCPFAASAVYVLIAVAAWNVYGRKPDTQFGRNVLGVFLGGFYATILTLL